MPRPKRSQQSHGLKSKIYVPILRAIFKAKYRRGVKEVDFNLDDIRSAALKLGIVTRNPADVIYRMRSRTKLPSEILKKGFFILRQVGRGKYRLEQAESTIVNIPENEIIDAIDITPLPVRRLLPEDLSEIDEQGLLTVVDYCKLLSHFTGLTVYRLRSHVRKGVLLVGQVELDEVDVGVALRDDDSPIIFPIEAKAADEAVNWVQVAAQVMYSEQYFPGYAIRPIAMKLDYDSLIHFLEFNVTTDAKKLKIIRSATYRLTVSEQQRTLIRTTTKVKH